MTDIYIPVMEGGLSMLADDADVLYLCSSEPSSFDDAGSSALGNFTGSAGSVFGATADNDSPATGRKITSNAITSGVITANGTASHWAVVDTASSQLLLTGALVASRLVFAGDIFSLPAFSVTQPFGFV